MKPSEERTFWNLKRRLYIHWEWGVREKVSTETRRDQAKHFLVGYIHEKTVVAEII